MRLKVKLSGIFSPLTQLLAKHTETFLVQVYLYKCLKTVGRLDESEVVTPERLANYYDTKHSRN